MEHKPTIYLDTSVPNFLFADDAPILKEITVDFFDNFIQKGVYKTYVSEFVIAEIDNTKNQEKRLQLYKSINDYPIEVLQIDERQEVEELAKKYIEAGVVPQKNVLDALHIATSTIYGINFLVSWNFKHLANIKREYMAKVVNIQNNYYNELQIITPIKLIDYGN